MNIIEAIARAMDPKHFDKMQPMYAELAHGRNILLDDARKAYEAITSAGFAIVPVEPTAELVEALQAACEGELDGLIVPKDAAQKIVAYVLSAAQEPT